MTRPADRSQPTVAPRRARRRTDCGVSQHERWLVSYADFITLLFAFFTTMYAISTVDTKKLSAMVESMQGAFEASGAALPRGAEKAGAGAHGLGTLGTRREPKNMGSASDVGLAGLQARLTERFAPQIAQHRVDVEMDHRGLVISIREAGSFAVGSADLSPEAQSLLAEVGATLAGIDNQIRVEGHTDDVPIHTSRFASNWELSTARGTNVVAFLLTHTPLRPEQLSAAGYAQYHPRVENSSDVNRARNRRVDLVILNSTTRAAEEPGRPPQ